MTRNGSRYLKYILRTDFSWNKRECKGELKMFVFVLKLFASTLVWNQSQSWQSWAMNTHSKFQLDALSSCRDTGVGKWCYANLVHFRLLVEIRYKLMGTLFSMRFSPEGIKDLPLSYMWVWVRSGVESWARLCSFGRGLRAMARMAENIGYNATEMAWQSIVCVVVRV